MIKNKLIKVLSVAGVSAMLIVSFSSFSDGEGEICEGDQTPEENFCSVDCEAQPESEICLGVSFS